MGQRSSTEQPTTIWYMVHSSGRGPTVTSRNRYSTGPDQTNSSDYRKIGYRTDNVPDWTGHRRSVVSRDHSKSTNRPSWLDGQGFRIPLRNSSPNNRSPSLSSPSRRKRRSEKKKNASGILLHRSLQYLVALLLLDVGREDIRRNIIDWGPSHSIVDIDIAVRDGDYHHLLLLIEEARSLIMKGLVWSQFLQLDTLCNLALRGPLLHMKLVWQWDLRMMIFNIHQNQISRNPILLRIILDPSLVLRLRLSLKSNVAERADCFT